MYNYDYYGTGTMNSSVFSGLFAFLWIFALIAVAISVFYTIVMWKIFKKAGQPGWAAIIPIYNIIVMLKVAKMPMWWLALVLIPVVNYVGAIVFSIVWSIQMAKVFSKDTTFGVLTIFFSFVMLPILAFGDAKYIYDNIESTSPEPVQPLRPTVEPSAPQAVEPMFSQPVEPMVSQPVQPITPQSIQSMQQTVQNETDVESFMPEVEDPFKPTDQNNIQ